MGIRGKEKTAMNTILFTLNNVAIASLNILLWFSVTADISSSLS